MATTPTSIDLGGATTALPAPNGTPLAPLGESLRHVQVDGVFYCPSELTEPWGLDLPPMPDCIWFHVVTSGEFTVEVEGETTTLRPGDLALVPHGNGHRGWGREPAPTRSVVDLPHEVVDERFAILRHGGGGERTDLVCGGLCVAQPITRHLMRSLPPLIVVPAAPAWELDRVGSTIRLLADEVAKRRPGGEAIISRLCDVVVIQAVQTWIERDPRARTGWLGALRDERLGAALARLHADPARSWSVDDMADAATMSRSAFAAAFTSAVGETPMAYLTRWRMNVALELLRTTDTGVGEVGRRVGYDSEAAFSRAFKRAVGMTPSDARRVTLA
ncbi:MAG: AraC family transcriptional regulator [Actinomycetota bacterium]